MGGTFFSDQMIYSLWTKRVNPNFQKLRIKKTSDQMSSDQTLRTRRSLGKVQNNCKGGVHNAQSVKSHGISVKSHGISHGMNCTGGLHMCTSCREGVKSSEQL